MDTKKIVLRVVSIVFGLALMLNSLNYYLHFYQLPALNPQAMQFVGALSETGYLMHLVKFIEFAGGLCLLTSRYVPLALVVLAPVVVNIFLVHLVLDPRGLPAGALLLISQVVLMWAYRHYYQSLASVEAEPDLGDTRRSESGKLAGQSA